MALNFTFSEDGHAVFYHDFRVYISGVDVSESCSGNIDVSLAGRDGTNTCSLQLSNAEDQWLLTAKNLGLGEYAEISEPERWKTGGDYQYGESGKKAVYDYKRNNPINALDELTQSHRWPFFPNGPVFHKHDPMRVFIHNPLTYHHDEWLPLFTGFCDNISFDDDYVQGGRSINITAYCIRGIMQKQRVQMNPVILGENQVDTDLYGKSGDGQGTQEVGIFGDLYVNNQNLNHPIAKRTLYEAFTMLILGYWPDDQHTSEDRSSLKYNLPILNKLGRRVKGIGAFLPGFVCNFKSSAEGLVTTEEMTNFTNARGEPLEGFNSLEDWYRLCLFGQLLELGGIDASDRLQPGTALLDPNYASMITDSYITQAMLSAGPAIREAMDNGEFTQEDVAAALTAKQAELELEAKQRIAATQATVPLAPITNEAGEEQEPEVITIGPWYNPQAIIGQQAVQDIMLAEVAAGAEPFSEEDLIMLEEQHTQTEVESDAGPIPLISDGTLSYDREFIPLSLVERIGQGTTYDGPYSPLRGRLHFLLPANGLNTRQIIEYTQDTGADTRSWSSRYDVLNEIAVGIDYQWWATPIGDIVVEFPMYDFYPGQFGVFGRGLIASKQLISSSIGDENGNVVTGIVISGGMAHTPENEGQTGISQVKEAIFTKTLAARCGINIPTVSVPFTFNKDVLAYLGYIEFQKQLAQANRAGAQFSYRPFLLPNKPFVIAERSRFSVINDVSTSIGIHETATTSVTLQYVRAMNADGSVRFITGSCGMPISYNLLTADTRNVLEEQTAEAASEQAKADEDHAKQQRRKQLIAANIAEVEADPKFQPLIRGEGVNYNVYYFDSQAESDEGIKQACWDAVLAAENEVAQEFALPESERPFSNAELLVEYDSAQKETGNVVDSSTQKEPNPPPETVICTPEEILRLQPSPRHSSGTGLPLIGAEGFNRSGTGVYLWPEIGKVTDGGSTSGGTAGSTGGASGSAASGTIGTTGSSGSATSGAEAPVIYCDDESSDISTLAEDFRAAVEQWMAYVENDLSYVINITRAQASRPNNGDCNSPQVDYHAAQSAIDFELLRSDGSKHDLYASGVTTAGTAYQEAGGVCIQFGLRWGGTLSPILPYHVDSGALEGIDPGHDAPKACEEVACQLPEKNVIQFQRSVDAAEINVPADLIQQATQTIGISRATLLAITAIESSGSNPNVVNFGCDDYNKAVSTGQQVPCTVALGDLFSKIASETNYAAFEYAYKKNPTVAVKCTAWGAFQVRDPVGNGLASSAANWYQRWNSEDKWRISIELLIKWFAPKVYKEAAQQAERDGGTVEAWIPFAKRYNGPRGTDPGEDYHKKLACAYNYALTKSA